MLISKIIYYRLKKLDLMYNDNQSQFNHKYPLFDIAMEITLNMSASKKLSEKNHSVYTTLDGMRGIAAFIIIFRHAQVLLGNNYFRQSYLAVDLFFILSGFVIANAYERKLLNGMPVKEFFIVRLIRLYPLYFLSVCFSIFLWYNHNRTPVSLVWHGILSLMFLPNPDEGLGPAFPLNGPTWSLFFEIFVNIFYAYFLKRIFYKIHLVLLAISGVTLILCVFALGNRGIDFGYSTFTLPGGFFRVIFSFYVGVLLFRMPLHRRFEMPLLLKGNFLSWIIIAIVAGLLTASPADWAVPIFDLVSVFFIFPLLIWLGTVTLPTGITASIFRYAGLVSYAVYVLHEPLASLVAEAYTGITGLPVSMVIPWIGVLFLPILIMTCFLFDAFYDTPLRALLRCKLKNSLNHKRGL